MRATVTRDGGDTHLGGNFIEPLVDTLAVLRIQLAGILFGDFSGTYEFANDFVRQVGIDSGGTVANQRGKVMRVAGRGGFYHNVGVTT